METSEINQLGKDLEIYTTVDYIGKGFPIFLPRGAEMCKIIEDYVTEKERENGYKLVKTPSASRAEVYIIEDRYNDDDKAFFRIQSETGESEIEHKINQIVLRPYSSPFHCSIFNETKRSYKDLPQKYCETSTVYRNETDIKGITKTRQITISDASAFVDINGIKSVLREIVEMQKDIENKLGIEVSYCLSNWDDTKKEDYIGRIDEWDVIYRNMKSVLEELEIPYTEDKKAMLYGPMITTYFGDIRFQAIQVDFEITHRFGLKYTTENNTEETPYYVHANIVGSYERLLSILIEKYKGDFPKWISPK